MCLFWVLWWSACTQVKCTLIVQNPSTASKSQHPLFFILPCMANGSCTDVMISRYKNNTLQTQWSRSGWMPQLSLTRLKGHSHRSLGRTSIEDLPVVLWKGYRQVVSSRMPTTDTLCLTLSEINNTTCLTFGRRPRSPSRKWDKGTRLIQSLSMLPK